eukprot:CAMPEP_0181231254 /NCGR_PEP_ID=MMETSP1096-20121128/34989_1 /TAXON_ID=156174 ORGANISM="Chrysochromulina ericina, Strain CCMP281" /NCGR_SAMPLE_ID=MMETSP1096 /ASSEMBLY_ACC=CAM_ASM_000453 /LENGTH=98 /DNA_ID=CAMNT_0023325245 /DNA_START=147 /DNA_END=440 /DNA_ORIENTATION=+
MPSLMAGPIRDWRSSIEASPVVAIPRAYQSPSAQVHRQHGLVLNELRVQPREESTMLAMLATLALLTILPAAACAAAAFRRLSHPHRRCRGAFSPQRP